ncbi:MAG: alkaline phosphatase family protein [Pyrinomonadaceae bacterium]
MFKPNLFVSIGFIFLSASLFSATIFGQQLNAKFNGSSPWLAVDENNSANSPAQPQTVVNHVIVVWFENRESTAITAATAPNFINFARTYANFTNFFGVTHPSQPNYLDLFSGSNQGVTDDGHHTFPNTVDNIARQMTAAGKSWRVYVQGFPGNCFNNDTFAGGIDGPGVAGQYVRKHNPAMTFQSVTGNPAECANVQPLANFDPTVNFAFVVPNMINDMHDGTTAQGDAFLQQFLPLVLNSPDFAHTLLVVSFDEGSTSTNGGGHIYTAAAAPWLNNKTITATYNHFSMLRTIEQIFGLPFLGSAANFPTISEILPPASRPQFDYDGDGRADVSVFRPSNGTWFLLQSTNGFTGAAFGQAGDQIVPADYDGDGKTDLAVYRNGTWFIQRSTLGFIGVTFGAATDIPQPADFDGDGKAELAVFRPSTGSWFTFNLANNQTTGAAFGQNGDKPVVGDYDGDGKADIAVNRAGTWFINRSTLGFTGLVFGDSNDKPVPADYDGDGKTDIAVFRPSNGTWFLQRSQSGFMGIAFGLGTDVPVPADYDGDGKADVAVFRNGTWFLQQSTAGFTGVTFGQSSDVPTPSAFGQ